MTTYPVDVLWGQDEELRKWWMGVVSNSNYPKLIVYVQAHMFAVGANDERLRGARDLLMVLDNIALPKAKPEAPRGDLIRTPRT